MHGQFEMFRGTLVSWQELFQEAAAFATALGRDRVISISHSADHGDGIVTVWYWALPHDATDTPTR